MSEELKLSIGGDSKGLKKAVAEAKQEIGGLNKAAKGAGAGGFESLNKGAKDLIGKFKEVGSKVSGLGGLIGGLVPGLGLAGLAVAGVTAAVNFGLKKWEEQKQLTADILKNLEDIAKVQLERINIGVSASTLEKKAAKDAQAEIDEITKKAVKRTGQNSRGRGGVLVPRELTDEEKKRVSELQLVIEQARTNQAKRDAEEARKKNERDEAAKKKAEEINAAKIKAGQEALEKAEMEEEFNKLSDSEKIARLEKINRMKAEDRKADGTTYAQQLEIDLTTIENNKKIAEIKKGITDKAAKEADEQKKKEEELAQLQYNRIWETATAEQKLRRAYKEYAEAKKKAEKESNTDNLIALEKAKDKVIETRKEVADLNKEKAKGVSSESSLSLPGDSASTDGKIRRGRVVISKEDRERTIQANRRAEELKPKGGMIRGGRTGADETKGKDPQLTQIIKLLTPKE